LAAVQLCVSWSNPGATLQAEDQQHSLAGAAVSSQLHCVSFRQWLSSLLIAQARQSAGQWLQPDVAAMARHLGHGVSADTIKWLEPLCWVACQKHI
jgi:hypothetical protein